MTIDFRFRVQGSRFKVKKIESDNPADDGVFRD
jgi:hypothetical protein